jgi:hypothetical protein
VSWGRRRELYQEYPPPGEQQLIQELVEFMKYAIAEKHFLSGATQRGPHPKSVAAFKAELTVDADLPAELRHGLFAQPGSYPAWIRISNANQTPGKDSNLDFRGFAIKLMGVPGDKLLPQERRATTHDFVLQSSRNFPARGLAQSLDLIKALNASVPGLLWFLLTNPWAALVIFTNIKRFANLLEVQFWSTTPYRLGPELAVKYSAKPRGEARDRIPRDPGRNYLREAAARTLRQREVVFDFFVQVQKDPYRQPIENALKIWSEELSPLQKVASIRIPRQEVDTSERNWIAENLQMNVWHALPDHRPLGGLNRGRLLTYLEIAEFRRTRNLLPPLEEPTAGPEFFADCGPSATMN